MKRAFTIIAVFIMLGMSQAHAEEKGTGAEHPAFEYVKLDPITLPVIGPKGLSQQVSLVVQLEVEWGNTEAVAPYEPRLVDAYLQDLYGALGAGRGLMKDNFVDVDKIKERLTLVTHKVMGPDHKIHAVLLQALQQRPL